MTLLPASLPMRAKDNKAKGGKGGKDTESAGGSTGATLDSKAIESKMDQSLVSYQETLASVQPLRATPGA